MPKAEFKEQQKYLWSLVRKMPLGQSCPRTELLTLCGISAQKLQVTHMNVLDEKQMRQAIATLRPYAAKAAHLQKKKTACGRYEPCGQERKERRLAASEHDPVGIRR